jgi:hypothetical protein
VILFPCTSDSGSMHVCIHRGDMKLVSAAQA